MTAPAAHQYRVTIRANHHIWVNDAGTLRRLTAGATIHAGDLKPDTIRTGQTEGWLTRTPPKGPAADAAVKSNETPENQKQLDIDEIEQHENPEAEERHTVAEPAAPANKATPKAPRTKRRK